MVGVMGGFMSAGHLVGTGLVARNQPALTVMAGFFLGMATVIAEPAVHVLTLSVEEETDGVIPRRVVLAFLAVGVAFSVALAVIRIYVEGLELWHILTPGYTLIMIMSYFTPDLFLGVAFDAGGVASGPMTATFILAFTQGIAAGVPQADLLLDGFGVVALVAMAPLITLQILGLISIWRGKRQRTATLPPRQRGPMLINKDKARAALPAHCHIRSRKADAMARFALRICPDGLSFTPWNGSGPSARFLGLSSVRREMIASLPLDLGRRS